MPNQKERQKSPQSKIPEALVIERVFEAPRERVFEAWTDPELLRLWTSPREFTITKTSGDLRPGGKWSATFHPESGPDLVVGGVYQEIEAPKRIVSTHYWLDERGKPGPETLMTVVLEDRGDETAMTFRQTGFETVEDRTGREAGWSECFEKLEELLAERVAVPVRR